MIDIIILQTHIVRIAYSSNYSVLGSMTDISGIKLQILGINMFVGIDGFIGKPMIREGNGIDIYVRRSLRDVFKKVPTFSLEVKVTFKLGERYG